MSTPVKKTTKKPAAKPTHPSFKAMTTEAMQQLRVLKVMKMSRPRIVKQILANHSNVDPARANRLVSASLKKLVEANQVMRLSGVGASGSFKLPPKSSEPKPAKKPKVVAKKPKAAAKPKAKKATTPKKAGAKKPAAAKKPATKKPAAAAKKPAAKKPVAKKPVAKKPVAKKPVAKKPVAKKPAAKKTSK